TAVKKKRPQSADTSAPVIPQTVPQDTIQSHSGQQQPVVAPNPAPIAPDPSPATLPSGASHSGTVQGDSAPVPAQVASAVPVKPPKKVSKRMLDEIDALVNAAPGEANEEKDICQEDAE